uniref:Integrase catalytic domain-containing protein n=1 Tax=Fagus sylvatica TaxID=28930 RepID=A0A2N9FPS7_FAGSY
MAGETSGPGPSEQEIRMVALERKFDELLSFVQLIAKRNTEDENQRKEDDKDTSEAEPEGHSNTNATPPRPPTPPKPEGKDSQLDSKIDSLEEKIRLIQGLNSFGNTDFSSMSWFPNMTVPPKFKAPEFEEIQWERRPHDPSANLKKISHWKELADTFLAQYGFNSQIAPDRFDLQRMEKKSNETFREYAQRWREKAARARPPLDEREMIKIFVDTLKNPYFDRMMGLQMQFFVDLIPVGDRIEDALKTKKIVDMTALMALAEQAAKKAPTKRKEGDVQMIGRNNGRPRQVLPTFTMQPIQPRPIQAPAPTQAPAPAPAPQMPARPEVGNQPNDNRWPQKRAKAIHAFTYAYDRVIPHPDREEPNLTYCPKTLQRPAKKGFQPKFGLRFPLWRSRGRERGEYRVEASLLYLGEKETHHPVRCTARAINRGLHWGEKKYHQKGSRQPDDPSEFDWYAEINLDDIVEDEMDLDNLQDEEADWGYFMEDDTDEWRDVDLTEFFQFPYLISATWYGEKMALHLENELLMISVFPESLSKQTAAWFYQLRNLTGWDDLDEEPYIIPDPGVSEVQFVEIKEESDMSSLPALAERGEEEKDNQATTSQTIITTTTAEEEYAGPMVEGLSIHTITERRIPPPHHRPATANREKKSRRGLAYHCYSVSRVVMSKRITRKTSNDPHVSKIDNKTDCSLDNIDNSDEEIELPSDILEALERQDEGSKPNIEELEIVNLANEGEEPREVKIGTRCAAEQKEALIALLREFHEIFAWSYQDMPGLDTDIVVHKIPLKPECKPVKASTATNEARSHFEDQGRGGKAIEGRIPKHSNLFGLGSQYSPSAEKGRKTTNVVFSFMDGFSGYNQIKMAEEDKSKTAFVTHWGTFVYDVMPFGLKNAGATYQRAMVTLFHDMIHHEIEVYVDDMIAKSRTAQDHLTDLRKLFQRLKKYQLRLNPNKCAFGVTSGKLLGFIVSGRGIEIDPAKTARKPFDKIKEYLLNPPILVPPTPGRPLILYLTVQEASMGCMLGQQDETGKKEQAIYYLSKKFTEPETRYLLVEKTCCALAWASKKLRQYMLYYTTWLVSRMDPIKYIFEKPALTGKIARWQVLLSEFDILFVARKGDQGTGHSRLLGRLPVRAVRVNGLRSSQTKIGIGAVLVSPKGQQTPIAVKLGFDCTNNMTEYEACIVGLQAALEFGAYELEVFGDSLLIVSQTNGEWQARDPKLIPYQRYISRLVPKFNRRGDDVRPLRIETRDIPAYCVCVEECMNVEAEIDDKPWYYDIKRFIQDREYPPRATENEKKYIRRMAFQFFLSGEILYKRTHDTTLLRCVDAEEANRLIQEMHAGLMGAHANGPFLARKIMRAGYYWLTMERDCIRHVQTCHKCQMYQNSKNAPPQYLHTMASPWPFSAWGMDVIGAITPKASNGHEFILVAIDYFTKWVEACSFKNVTQVAVTQLCQQFKIQHHNSAPYRPKMNGAVEAANKNVKKILSKMTETYKDWHEHLPYALCAYRTSVRTSVGATSLLSGIWDGSSTTSRSGDPFFENPVTNSAGRSRMGPSHAPVGEPQCPEDDRWQDQPRPEYMNEENQAHPGPESSPPAQSPAAPWSLGQVLLQLFLSILRNLELLSDEVVHRAKSRDIPSLSHQVAAKVRHRHTIVMQGTPQRLYTSRRRLSLRRPSKA